jgi:hypothetical protein
MDYVVLTTKGKDSGEVCHHVIKIKGYSRSIEDDFRSEFGVKGKSIFASKDYGEAINKLDELRAEEKSLKEKVVPAETFNILRIDAELEKDLEEARQKRRLAKGKGDSSLDT